MGGLVVAGLLPFVASALVGTTLGPRSRWAGWLATATAAACLLLVLGAWPTVTSGPSVLPLPWIPTLGLSLSLLIDGLSLAFALIITSVGVLVAAFSSVYLGEDENRRRFFAYLLLFMGAMLGVVLSSNLIAVFVFWELTSLSSFLLIGFWHRHERSRNGALKALLVTTIGGLAMMVGFIMVGVACDSFEIPVIIERKHLLMQSPWALPATLFVIAGILTKSAQMPFHFWLPSAMEAPTPVSAYLHAATMVKAGLYLTARLGPLFGGIEPWSVLLTTVGLVTMVWGGFLALRQRDLKALLAFSTISQLGLILALLANPQPEVAAGGLFHLFNHAAFKGALFLLVGIIEHTTHTRDIDRLGSLRSSLPFTWTLLALAALSMAGVPPLGGFVSKEMFLAAAMDLPPLLMVLAFGGAVLTAAYSFALILALAGSPAGNGNGAHKPSWSLLAAPALLVGVAIALGLFPGPLASSLLDSAASAASAHTVHVHLASWHGFSPALLASAMVLSAGLLVYLLWWKKRQPDVPRLYSDLVYEGFLVRLESWAKTLTASYMSGLLWRYSAVVVATAAGGVMVVVFYNQLPPAPVWPPANLSGFEYLLALAAVVAVLATAMATTRLAAILALGASGYMLALFFALLGAPDLVLTQILVETVSVALFLAVFVFLPTFKSRPALRPFRPGHFALSFVAGFGACALVWTARGNRIAESISGYFITNSVPAAGGHNIVNVILVDFRGLDTLGEITVLGIAALACYGLIKIRHHDKAAQ